MRGVRAIPTFTPSRVPPRPRAIWRRLAPAAALAPAQANPALIRGGLLLVTHVQSYYPRTTLCALCATTRVKFLNEIPFQPRSACFPRFPTHWMSDTRTANGTHTQERKFRLCLVAPFKLYLVAPSLSHPWRRPFDRTELLHEV